MTCIAAAVCQLQGAAACAKAQFDKFVLDKTEEKAEFDRALEHSGQKATVQKAVADKALLDMGEMQVGAVLFGYRCRHSGVWDEPMQVLCIRAPNLTLVRLASKSVAQTRAFFLVIWHIRVDVCHWRRETRRTRAMQSCQLAEASSVGRYPTTSQASAVAAKARFDKLALDKAEDKAVFDRVLEHSVQEAAAQKAVADKALLDMGEMEVSFVQNACGPVRVGILVARHGCVRRAPAIHAQEVGHKKTSRRDCCADFAPVSRVAAFGCLKKYMRWGFDTGTSLRMQTNEGARRARLSAC